MKKIAIIILVIVIALSYACDKDIEKVSTTIKGQLRINGTENPIKVSKELSKPEVGIYHVIDQVGYTSSGYQEVASAKVDDQGNFSITIDLEKGGDYFYGVGNLDTTIYFSGESYHYWNGFYNYHYNRINAGENNTIYPYCLAKSWIRPRFINTNTDVNNVDVFDLSYGIGPDADDYVIDPNAALYFDKVIGKCDSLAPWIHKTWSGKYKYGLQKPGMIHLVKGKLTRNGVTKDVSIEYFAPPFDTSIVEIRY